MGFGETVVYLAGIAMITAISVAALWPRRHSGMPSDMRQEIEDELVGKLDDRIDSIERRMSNIETIVLDREKHEEFDRSL